MFLLAPFSTWQGLECLVELQSTNWFILYHVAKSDQNSIELQAMTQFALTFKNENNIALINVYFLTV